MFGPIFRSLSIFVFVVAFLAGCTGAHALIFQGDSLKFGLLLVVAVVAIVGALKMREASGELNLVAITPEDMAQQFEISIALGLGAKADTGKTIFAGMAAGGLIVIGVALAGLITNRAFGLALILVILYGGLLALAKRRVLLKRSFIAKGGKKYGAHRRLSVYLIPAITLVWLVITLPEADPLAVTVVSLGLLWWIGAAFHHAWELLHTTFLILFYGENNPQIIRWGLVEWLEQTRVDVRVDSVDFDGHGKVIVEGEFDNPDELRRDLQKLDFVTTVQLESIAS